METHILKEGGWVGFIQKNVLPSCVQNTNAHVFALVGDLGAGKTTFSKNFLHELGVKQHVQSPTFSIINSYDISFKNFTKVFHIDAYRIDDLKELDVLHIDEVFSNPNHLVVIEWADKIKMLIPKDAVWIHFEHDSMETRKVTINTHE